MTNQGGIYQEAIAGNGISYRQYGKNDDAPALILAMGYGGTMFAWPLNFVMRLAEKRSVIIFDNRGTGRSHGFENGFEASMHDLAEDLKGLVQDLQAGNHKIVDLLGYSMGGCIALEFAKNYPELCRKIILQSTTAGGSLYSGAEPEVKERLANPRGTNFDEMLFDFFDLCMNQEAMKKNRITLDAICANARPYPTSPKVLQTQLKAFRKFDASTYVSELKKECFLIHGRKDRILKVPNGEKLAENLLDCQSLFFDDCGHCPHIEYEQEVLAGINDFLNN